MAAQGLVLDVGHGQGSFNYQTARRAIERGLLPTVISTDLHVGCIWGPAWDLATVMSKMLTVGMSVDDVIERLTVFEVADAKETLPDSDGNAETIRRFFEPRHTILGTVVTPAARNTVRDRRSISI